MVMLENKDFICVQCPTIQYFRLVLTKEKQKRTKSNLLVFQQVDREQKKMAEKNNIPQFVNSDSFMADKNYVKWLSDLKKRFRMSQLKAAVKVNTEMLKFYWSLGEDICEKQKQYKWGANFMKRLSLDLRAEFPQAEGFSWSNLYKIRKWYLFYSSQIEFCTKLVQNYKGG